MPLTGEDREVLKAFAEELRRTAAMMRTQANWEETRALAVEHALELLKKEKPC